MYSRNLKPLRGEPLAGWLLLGAISWLAMLDRRSVSAAGRTEPASWFRDPTGSDAYFRYSSGILAAFIAATRSAMVFRLASRRMAVTRSTIAGSILATWTLPLPKPFRSPSRSSPLSAHFST